LVPRSLTAVLLLVLLALGASCSDEPDPRTGAEPSPSPSAPADDPPGALTCGQVVTAVREGTLMVPGVVMDIAAASATADAPVADAAQRLSAAYAAAVKAEGRDEEPDAIAAVSAAGAEMAKACATAGLETAG
jgi:hypothetical protein